MQNLFQAAQARSTQGGVKPLLEFRAGKMTRNGSTVTADTRKGLVQITVEESILHFKWRDRTTNTIEDDLMIFPDEAVFKRVDKVKDGRVYVLEFTGGGREMFFWLQEPKTDKDEANCTSLNEFIKNPPQNAQSATQQQNFLNMFSQQGGAASASRQQSAVELDQLQRILQGLGAAPQAQQQQQQQQPTTQQQQPTSSTTTNSDNQATQQQALQEALASLSGMQSRSGNRSAGPSLSSVLNSDGVSTALRQHPEMIQQLIEHLPEGDKQADLETVIDHVRSPQFRQSIDAFYRALQQSPEAVCYSIGIRPTTDLLTKIYSGSGAEALVNAVNEQEKKDDKKDDQMETDE